MDGRRGMIKMHVNSCVLFVYMYVLHAVCMCVCVCVCERERLSFPGQLDVILPRWTWALSSEDNMEQK